MTGGELGFDVGEGDAHLLVEYEEMVDQVRNFVDVGIPVAGHGLDDGLSGLFADLLGNLLHALAEKMSSIATLRHLGMTALDDPLKLADEPLGLRCVET